MSAILHLEGGGDSKELHIRCREGFNKLLHRAGFAGRMPRLVASGSRQRAFDRFCTAHQRAKGGVVALLIDSEEPLRDVNEAWQHLSRRDHWSKPPSATDEQVLFMTTCMETWLVADVPTLRQHYGDALQESALPPLTDLESRSRQAVLSSLEQATRDCQNRYEKGKRSFVLLGKLDPTVLQQSLPSFQRCLRILTERL